MKPMNYLKHGMIAVTLALFVSACATTQEEVIQGDGTGIDQSQSGGSGSSGDLGSSGVDSSVDGSGSSGSGALAGGEMSAAQMLQQTDGALSNRTIYFEFDSATLTDESIRILEEHGNFIAANGEVSVRLEGHADERGSREYNIGLGDRRAQSVRRVLLFQGAATEQVDTVSYGEERPADSGHDEAAWSMNRRVELVYTVN